MIYTKIYLVWNKIHGCWLSMKNYYEVLEISENASQEVIERVYKLFAKKYHPDVNPDNPKEAEEKFKEITEAYETLSDETKRKAYDDKLRLEKKKAEAETASYQNTSNYRTTSSSNTYSYTQQTYEQPQHTASQAQSTSSTLNDNVEMYENLIKEQQERLMAEREYQIKRAYNDAYVEALKSMGIKVVYKKTFEEKFRSFIALVIYIIVLVGLGFIMWQIPSFRESVYSIIELSPFKNLQWK